MSKACRRQRRGGEVGEEEFYRSAVRDVLRKIDELPKDFFTVLRQYCRDTDLIDYVTDINLTEEHISMTEVYIAELKRIAKERGLE